MTSKFGLVLGNNINSQVDTVESPAASMFSFTLQVKPKGYCRTRSPSPACAQTDKEGGMDMETAAGFFAQVSGGERFMDYVRPHHPADPT